MAENDEMCRVCKNPGEWHPETDAELVARIIMERDERIGELTAMLSDVVALIEESRGVDGWHLNGETATWDEVLPGFVDEYVALIGGDDAN